MSCNVVVIVNRFCNVHNGDFTVAFTINADIYALNWQCYHLTTISDKTSNYVMSYFRVYTYQPLNMLQVTSFLCMRVLIVQGSLLASGRLGLV